jgi:hypothetical protein
MDQLEIKIDEFYQIIGELETLRRKQVQHLQMLYKQIEEMNAEIQRLRNGGLDKADNIEQLRSVR